MALAIFGIDNDGLNLFVSLLVFVCVVVWLALIVYTYLDARRRLEDPFLVGCATIASFFPFIGTAVYAIVRPPEFLEDAHERELEIKAAELRVRQLTELSCPNCEYPIEKSFLRCPNCQRRLKDPCPSCSKPVDPRWALCPFCETALPGRERRRQRPAKSEGRGESRGRSAPRESAPKREPASKRPPSSRTKPQPSPRGSQQSARRAAAVQEPPPAEEPGSAGKR